MKLKKPKNKWYTPSDAYLSLNKPEMFTPPKEGPVNLYLDDERPCPEGWVLVRTSDTFFAFLDNKEVADRITCLSIDAYLKKEDIDGVTLVTMLTTRFSTVDNFLPKLQKIGFHNKNRTVARQMDQIIATRVPRERLDTFFVMWGVPQLQASMSLG